MKEQQKKVGTSHKMLPLLKDINVSKMESSRLHDRKCGEWLKENVKQGGDKRWHPKSQDVTLDNIGVSKMESSRLHDRKCGEWLKENVKQGGEHGNQYKKVAKSQDVTLANIGVSRMESSRAINILPVTRYYLH